MYLNNIQFELWKNCTNGCNFCFNKGCTCSTKEDKIRILKEVYYAKEYYYSLKYYPDVIIMCLWQ